MDVAFILDPLPELKAYKDSSVAMMRALAARGHRLFAMEQRDLLWDAAAHARRARGRSSFAPTTHDWYRAGAPEVARAQGFRGGDHAQGPAVRHGVRLLDVPARSAPSAKARASSTARARSAITTRRWRSRNSREFIAPTLVTRDADLVGAFIDEQEDVIVKPLDGMGGAPSSACARRSEPQRDRRDGVAARRAHGHGAALSSPRSSTATSACC